MADIIGIHGRSLRKMNGWDARGIEYDLSPQGAPSSALSGPSTGFSLRAFEYVSTK